METDLLFKVKFLAEYSSMTSGRNRRNVRVSGRQQFGLHLVKGKILERGKKGKGALKGSRTAGLEERANGGRRRDSNCIWQMYSALYACMGGRTVITSIQHCLHALKRGCILGEQKGIVFALDEFLLTKQLSNSIALVAHFEV